jgi:hypothetical protein
MTTEEAKFILQAYRPGGQDATDPQFAEALAQAKNDPELARWFAGQITFDAASIRALGEVRAPRNLKESILAGHRVIAPSRGWLNRPRLWAIAASVAILITAAGLWLNHDNNRPRFARFRDEMAAASKNEVRHVDKETQDPKQIQAWLAGHGADVDVVLPAGLQGIPAMGCKVLDWNGRKVSMFCYQLENGAHHLDLFTARKADFTDAPPEGKLQLAGGGSLMMAGWTRGDTTYLLVGNGDETFFKKYSGILDVALRPPSRISSALTALALTH